MELLWRFAMIPYRNTYLFLFCFCRCLKQGCNMFFMSCCAYYIYINIDGISRYVMLESLPIHNLRFGAFKIVNLDCTRPVDFFDMKWPFHLESSLSGENLKWDLNNKTLSPTLDSRFRILLSCHFFTFSLNILAFSQASLFHSSREVKLMRRFSP